MAQETREEIVCLLVKDRRQKVVSLLVEEQISLHSFGLVALQWLFFLISSYAVYLYVCPNKESVSTISLYCWSICN